jgi:hypothetical protein
MNAKEVKLALAIAQNTAIDLSGYPFDHLDGCGLPEFKPVATDLHSVARLMRWQYLCLDGSWDWKLWDEERWIYRDRIRLAVFSEAELAKIAAEALAGGAQ